MEVPSTCVPHQNSEAASQASYISNCSTIQLMYASKLVHTGIGSRKLSWTPRTDPRNIEQDPSFGYICIPGSQIPVLYPQRGNGTFSFAGFILSKNAQSRMITLQTGPVGSISATNDLISPSGSSMYHEFMCCQVACWANCLAE